VCFNLICCAKLRNFRLSSRTPTPTLPRKRERGQFVFGFTVGSLNPVVWNTQMPSEQSGF
ncbi:MAG: hypothetical protein Q4D82_03660, partial [Neisseria sp.]|nr:hypothetical protein [Neisseria sp.]